MQEYKIELRHVYKRYKVNEPHIIEDFNLSVKDREFIVFVGPSGCGKSTTLRMIAGIESISDGQLFINGEFINHLPAKDREVAMVFQNYALYPHMTVFDNIGFGLKVRKVKKEIIREKVQAAANILGLTEYLQKKPKDLSGGQRQRVALGRAIVRDTAIFLMDEPLSNLDAKLRNQMRAEILQLHQELGATTIYVTHDQTEAMTMATRIVVLKDGIIQQIGTPSEIYQEPSNVFVATFMGSPPMNLLHGLWGETGIRIEHTLHCDFRKNTNEQEVLVGIRPEHWKIVDEGEGVPFQIQLMELLGADVYLHGEFQNKKIVMRQSAKQTFEVGDVLYISVEPAELHLFDPNTELIICRGRQWEEVR